MRLQFHHSFFVITTHRVNFEYENYYQLSCRIHIYRTVFILFLNNNHNLFLFSKFFGWTICVPLYLFWWQLAGFYVYVWNRFPQIKSIKCNTITKILIQYPGKNVVPNSKVREKIARILFNLLPKKQKNKTNQKILFWKILTSWTVDLTFLQFILKIFTISVFVVRNIFLDGLLCFHTHIPNNGNHVHFLRWHTHFLVLIFSTCEIAH